MSKFCNIPLKLLKVTSKGKVCITVVVDGDGSPLFADCYLDKERAIKLYQALGSAIDSIVKGG